MNYTGRAFQNFDEREPAVSLEELRRLESTYGLKIPESVVQLYTTFGWGAGFCSADSCGQIDTGQGHYLVIFDPVVSFEETASFSQKGFFIFGGDGGGERIVASEVGGIYLKNVIDRSMEEAIFVASEISDFFKKSIDGTWFE